MNGVLGHESILRGAVILGRAQRANGMNFVMNHTPGAGSIARLVNQQSSVIPLYHRCSLNTQINDLLLTIFRTI